MYETLVLIDPESSVTADQLEKALHHRFPIGAPGGPKITRNGAAFKLSWSDFSLEIVRSQLPHVIEESEDLAERAPARHSARPRIARCSARFEIAGDEDFDMMYFNDFCFVLGEIEHLGTVYTFDQASGKFMSL